MPRTLIIGDVHGRLERLEKLLLQEGLIGPCDMCVGSGDVSDGTGAAEFCSECAGNGLARTHEGRRTRIIQLGDLVDLMPARTSPTSDEMIVAFADKWIDEFLWGNHERPLSTVGGPHFSNFMTNPTVQHRLRTWEKEGRIKLATHVWTQKTVYLVTHAGLSDLAFENERTGSLNRYSPQRLSSWINRTDLKREYVQKMWDGYGWELRDNISWYRDGNSHWGGIIWRDSREGLWQVPQIFGHTSHEEPLTIEHDGLTSYCIDTSKDNGLAAIMLEPDEEPRLINVTDDEPEPEPHDPISDIPPEILRALIV